MADTKTYILGSLVVLIVAGLLGYAIVINLPHNLKLEILPDSSKFYICENVSIESTCRLYATETFTLEGVTDWTVSISDTVDNSSNLSVIRRENRHDNILIVQEYLFDGNALAIEDFPIKETLYAYNVSGLKYEWIISGLNNSGTQNFYGNDATFGRMKLYWDSGYKPAFKSASIVDDVFTASYDFSDVVSTSYTVECPENFTDYLTECIETPNEIVTHYNDVVLPFRLFDPLTSSSTFSIRDYPLRALINCSGVVTGTPVLVNFSRFIVNGSLTNTSQVVVVNCRPDLYLYFINESDYVFTNNDTGIAPYVSVSGSSINPSYNVPTVFTTNNAFLYMPFKSSSSSGYDGESRVGMYRASVVYNDSTYDSAYDFSSGVGVVRLDSIPFIMVDGLKYNNPDAVQSFSQNLEGDSCDFLQTDIQYTGTTRLSYGNDVGAFSRGYDAKFGLITSFKITANKVNDSVIVARKVNGTNAGWSLVVTPAMKLNFTISEPDTGASQSFVSTMTIQNNSWYQVGVWNVDDGQVIIWINDNQANIGEQIKLDMTITGDFYSSDVNLTIGGMQGTVTNRFTGYIANTYLYTNNGNDYEGLTNAYYKKFCGGGYALLVDGVPAPDITLGQTTTLVRPAPLVAEDKCGWRSQSSLDYGTTQTYMYSGDRTVGNYNDSSNFSFSFWAKSYNIGTTQVSSYKGVIAQNRIISTYVSGSKMVFAITNGTATTGLTNIYSTTTLVNDTWYHFGFTYDGSTKNMSLYVNGVLENSTIATKTGDFYNTTVPDYFRIGLRSDAGLPWLGTISDFKLYNSYKSASDILTEYNAKDCSVYKDNWKPDKYYYPNYASNYNTPETTMVARVKLTTASTTATNGIYTSGESTTNRYMVTALVRGGTSIRDRFYGYIRNRNIGTNSAYAPSIFTQNDTWYCLAMTFNGSKSGDANTLKLYVNGVLQTLTFAGTTPERTANHNAAGVNGYIGFIPGSNTYSTDLITDVRQYTRELTATEIGQICNGTIYDESVANSDLYFHGVPSNFKNYPNSTPIKEGSTATAYVWNNPDYVDFEVASAILPQLYFNSTNEPKLNPLTKCGSNLTVVTIMSSNVPTNYDSIFGMGNTTHRNGFSIWASGGIKPNMPYFNTVGTFTSSITSNQSITPNTKTMIAFRNQWGNATFNSTWFINGVISNTVWVAGSPSNCSDVILQEPFWLGYSPTVTTYYPDMKIYHLALYDRILTDDELTSIYNNLVLNTQGYGNVESPSTTSFSNCSCDVVDTGCTINCFHCSGQNVTGFNSTTHNLNGRIFYLNNKGTVNIVNNFTNGRGVYNTDCTAVLSGTRIDVDG